MNPIKCASAEEVHRAISNTMLPEIFGTFEITLETRCGIIIKSGSPTIHLYSAPTVVWVHYASTPTICTYADADAYWSAHKLDAQRIEVKNDSHVTLKTFANSKPQVVIYDTGGVTHVKCNSYNLCPKLLGRNVVFNAFSEKDFQKNSLETLLSEDPL